MSCLPDPQPRYSQRRRLKNFLINPRVQLRYAALAAGSGLVLSLAHTAVFYSFVRENYETLVELSPMTAAVRQQLYRELGQIITYLSLASLSFIVLTALAAVVASHRAVGPLYHFKQVFDDVRKGKFKTRIRLRPGDDFQDVAESFNLMLDRLERLKQPDIQPDDAPKEAKVKEAKNKHAA